mmetsp:Transcript_10502/g.39048  ORF Transcript_10502/g.39048 Transcript_10502/m.39048 type:complete len:439 (-) Transcript_10502:312-1628(-)
MLRKQEEVLPTSRTHRTSAGSNSHSSGRLTAKRLHKFLIAFRLRISFIFSKPRNRIFALLIVVAFLVLTNYTLSNTDLLHNFQSTGDIISDFDDGMYPVDGSPKQKTRLIAFVTTSSNYDKMARLRKQWQRNLKLLPKETDAKLFFVVGDLDMNFNMRPPSELKKLKKLNETTGDILIARGVTDTQKAIGGFCPVVPVSSTTQKVLWAVKWAVRNYQFDYFARVGDDAYFRVDHFLQNVAPTQPNEKLYMGHFFGPLPCPNHMDGIRHKYALGMGYIFTYDVTRYLASLNPKITRFEEPEDATVGMWLLGLRLNRVHDTRFHNVRRFQGIEIPPTEYHAWSPCTRDDILLHYINGDMWDTIDDDGVMHCTEEHYGPRCCRLFGCPSNQAELTRSGMEMTHVNVCPKRMWAQADFEAAGREAERRDKEAERMGIHLNYE